MGGIVYFVGAGPGHPGLITLRGVECLQRADVVLYDYLANAHMLMHAREGAEPICLGQHGRSSIWSQAAINETLVARATAGERVVRLKGGDPMIFGRASEEVRAVAAAGLPFEIVPGITAAGAAAAYAGVAITDRDHASAVALVTGHERLGKPESAVDYASLAAFPGTLIFYMGVHTVDAWSGQLIAAGKSPTTPVRAVRRASWPDQTVLTSTLGTLARDVAAHQLRPPVVFVVGPAATATEALDWYPSLPLLGKKVVVTRPRDGADALATRLREAGAHVLLQPAIEIGPPDDWRPLDDALAQLDAYQWVVFSSANGVRAFMDRLGHLGKDARVLGSARLAAIGPATTKALASYHLVADLQPHEYRAEALAEALEGSARGQTILLVRASRGREVLRERLTAAGAHVQQVVAYSSTDVQQLDPAVEAALAAGAVDWVTVTSSAIARSIVALFGVHLAKTKLASISPITSQTLRELGQEVAAEAETYTSDGLLDALLASAHA